MWWPPIRAGNGVAPYDAAWALDWEGSVAKLRNARDDERAGWVKIRNRSYTQIIDRNELFSDAL